jgi:3-deoxy-manno-octulosonate cytidylyltransferase (CMP-KDO synthetase)
MLENMQNKTDNTLDQIQLKNGILGVIPARYKSTRFEGKPLVSIEGIPMIKRTYNQAIKSKELNNLIVATDDQRIIKYCNSENMPVVMTSPDCLTGTDRLAEVAEIYNYELYINIQGDEPIIDPFAITQIINTYKEYGSNYMVYNLYKIITDSSEINSKTIVKVIVNEKDEVMYMSRLPVPFSNSSLIQDFKQQIPVYGFTREALALFSKSSKTINEKYEDIELLRFIDLGYKIKMQETHVDSIAVDVPDDIKKIEKFLRSKNNAK